MTAALRIRNLSKTFPGQRALDGVDIEIDRGEIHALVGQNGSGKSTIVKILAGYHAPDPGAVAEVTDVPFDARLGIGGRGGRVALRPPGPRPRRVDDGVRQLPHESAAAGRWRRCAASDDRRDALAALAALGYDIDPARTIAELAESERTAVGVARALDGAGEDGRFPLLVLDEATAALPGPEVERLFGALRRVAAAGTAVLFISHYLDEVLAIADRVTVLRDGRRVATETGSRRSPTRASPTSCSGRELVAESAAHTRLEPPAAATIGRCCRCAASAVPSWPRSTSTCAAARSSASPA